jgi:hypothetical protein
MGEAKRRRQQPAERTVIELDEQTNEERRVETIVRDGGSVATFLKKGLNGVPCNGCRMCCYHPRIEVEPQDDIRHLDIETHEDGGQTLRRREDGSCVHLGPDGFRLSRPVTNRWRSSRSFVSSASEFWCFFARRSIFWRSNSSWSILPRSSR